MHKKGNFMRIALLSLGCKVNSYETDGMKQQFEKEGYEIVSFNSIADIYLVNTCTVTNVADKKSRQMLHRAKRLNPNSIVIAVGCYVKEAGKEFLHDKSIDILFGNNNK